MGAAFFALGPLLGVLALHVLHGDTANTSSTTTSSSTTTTRERAISQKFRQAFAKALGELELVFELDQLQRAKTVHIGDTKSREARIAGLEKDVARCTTLLANFKVTRTTPADISLTRLLRYHAAQL